LNNLGNAKNENSSAVEMHFMESQEDIFSQVIHFFDEYVSEVEKGKLSKIFF
jgi:hypothetical protein